MGWTWNDYSVLEFRSSPVDDPEALDDDDVTPLYKAVQIAVQDVTTRRPNEAEVQKYAGGAWSRATRLRGVSTIKTMPLSNIPTLTTGQFQDSGVFSMLENILYGVGDGPGARHPYVFWYAAYASGADPDAGPLLRAGIHAHDVNGANDYFTTTLILPVRIIFEGVLEPQRGRKELNNLDFTIKTAEYLDA